MPATIIAVLVDIQFFVWPVLAVVLGLGLLALFAPDAFALVATRGSKWVDTERVLQALDKPIDVDHHVLRYSRIFGVLVALSALWLGYVFWILTSH
jgi:hypothetical protein